MYQNPDKYDKKLNDIIRQVYEAAPLFQEKLDQLNSIINHYDELCKEEEELNKQKLNELELYQNNDERCSKSRESASRSKEQYENVVDQLKSIILKEAKHALKNKCKPLIFTLKKMNGQTPLIDNTRIKSRMISLRSKIIQKMDILHELQRNVYCFDEFSEISNYNNVSDFDFQSFPGYNEDLWTTQNISQYLLDHFQAQYERVPRIPLKSISLISKLISPNIDKFESPDSIPLYLASFKSQHLRKEMNNIQFNSYLSNSLSKFVKIFGSEKSIKEKIDSVFSEINSLFRTRQEILRNICSSYENAIPIKVISCIGTLVNCSEEIRKSQFVIDTLNFLIPTNASIPTSIWKNEQQIRYKMKQLVNLIDHISNSLSKTQRYVKIEPFGYHEPKGVMEIEEISSTQINQCKELISDLQSSFASLEIQKYSTLEEIADTVNDLETIKQLRDEDEKSEISENIKEKDSSVNSANNFSFTEDEELNEIMQRRAIFLEKQNEELRNLMEIVKTLPDDLKEVSFNQEDIDFKPSPLPTIELPQLLSDDEDDSTNAFQLSYSRSSLTDEISESNNRLIEQIKAKNNSQRASYLSSNNQEEQQQQKITVVKNEELESIVKSIQPNPKHFRQISRPEPLIAKKNHLIEYVNNLPLKLEHVQYLKKDIDSSEKTIKNFPNFKERKMKELESKKEEINELKEQIRLQENSDKYKEYKNICAKIVSAQEDLENLDNEE